jgi:Tol biopolymer transport system component
MRKFNLLRLSRKSLSLSLLLFIATLALGAEFVAARRAVATNIAPGTALKTNGKIAFSTTRDGDSEIYVMNADGSNQTRLTVNPAIDADPGWSPDGTRLVFVSTRDGNEEIYVMNADGSNQTRLTNNDGADRTPVWSPDGSQIAFASNRGSGEFDIFVMKADGSSAVNISGGNGAASYQEPDWSPDGTKIVCSQSVIQNGVRGPYGVLVMNADGSNQLRLSAAGLVEINPRWSPDGTRIAFASNRAGSIGSFEVFVMNADGSNQGRLTNNAGENSRPFWSPDGTKIAFQSDLVGSFDIYVVNTDGSNRTRITNQLTDDFQPVWQAVSSPATNPIDDATLFVRRHYLDFLYREPDAGGLAYWVAEITRCGADAACVTRKRADVSAAFFVEQEFQQTGYFIYRLYSASFCRRPTFNEFTSDRAKLMTGPNLEATRQALALEFVQRAEFLSAYPLSLDGPAFIDALLSNVRNCSGVDLTAERANLLVAYNQPLDQSSARASVLRLVMDNPAYIQAEFNKAFVQSAYFGYLRRDEDQGGYLFWLGVLNSRVPGNYRAMVCAFITSAEYQRRFGTNVTRSNNDCSAINP